MAKKILANTNEISHEEWLQYRMQGIGGSDASAAVGMNRWKSPLALWAEKTGQITKKDGQSEQMHWGNLLETVIRDEFANRNPELTVQQMPYIFQSVEHPFAIANLDGIVKDKNGNCSILEIKTASAYREFDWQDGVPLEYVIQVQHYMLVTGLNHAYIALLLGGNKYMQMELHRDESIIQYLILMESAFWQSVQDLVQPPVSELDGELLNQLYPKPDNAGGIILPAEADGIIAKYLNAKSAEDAAKKQKAEAENQLKAMMGKSAAAITKGGYKINWTEVNSNRFNSSRFQADNADLYHQYCEASSFRRFSVTAPKTK